MESLRKARIPLAARSPPLQEPVRPKKSESNRLRRYLKLFNSSQSAHRLRPPPSEEAILRSLVLERYPLPRPRSITSQRSLQYARAAKVKYAAFLYL